MVRLFAFLAGSSSKLRRQGRAGFLLLVLALGAGSIAPLAPAQAAPAALSDTVENVRSYLNIAAPDVFCVGQERTVRVTPMVEISGRRADRTPFIYSDRIVPGVLIKAEITDTGIATVAPASRRAGAIPQHLLYGTAQYQSEAQNLGEVEFTLTGKKGGTTDLILTAEVPSQFTNGPRRWFGPGGNPGGRPIRVLNCAYEVTMIYQADLTLPAARLRIDGLMNRARLAREGESLFGESQIDFMQVLGGNPHCTYDISTGQSTASMRATFSESPSGQQVTVNFDYGPLSQVTPWSCTVPYFGTRTGSSSWSGVPPVAQVTSETFPATGGTKRLALAGGARLTITLKPIVEESQ